MCKLDFIKIKKLQGIKAHYEQTEKATQGTETTSENHLPNEGAENLCPHKKTCTWIL
jgi:hypothetical protein